MELRKNAAVDILSLSSMGVRITPVNSQPVHVSNQYEMQSTSAETNVLNVSASLGLSAKVLTKFVEGSPIASFIKSELRKRNIAYEGVDIAPDGPWGVRHQFNIADSGFGSRGPVVYNDRAGEVGRTIAPEDYDLERIFKTDGCRLVHLSGLIVSMSESTLETCLAIANMAKQTGALVSFDLNYRASFWRGRENELMSAFKEIASLADILIGNEEEYQFALGVEGPPADGTGLTDGIENFKEMVDRAAIAFPNVKIFATTLREVECANEHLWGALLRANGVWYQELPRPIRVLDRIGGGDGFVGGLLYGILKQWEPEKCLKFGWATGALATTMLTDYATPTDEGQVWSIYEGNARVKR